MPYAYAFCCCYLGKEYYITNTYMQVKLIFAKLNINNTTPIYFLFYK